MRPPLSLKGRGLGGRGGGRVARGGGRGGGRDEGPPDEVVGMFVPLKVIAS